MTEFTSFPASGARLRGRTLWDLFAEVRSIVPIKTIDQNVGPSNIAMQEVDEVLAFLEAEKLYAFHLHFQHSTGTTPDIKFGFSYPTGTTMDYAAFVFGSTGTWVATRNTETAVFSPSGGSTQSSAWLHGTIQVGSESGFLQLMSAQNTSDASTTNVEAGTMFRLSRIDP
jgi:hypothetical protein